MKEIKSGQVSAKQVVRLDIHQRPQHRSLCIFGRCIQLSGDFAHRSMSFAMLNGPVPITPTLSIAGSARILSFIPSSSSTSQFAQMNLARTDERQLYAPWADGSRKLQV